MPSSHSQSEWVPRKTWRALRKAQSRLRTNEIMCACNSKFRFLHTPGAAVRRKTRAQPTRYARLHFYTRQGNSYQLTQRVASSYCRRYAASSRPDTRADATSSLRSCSSAAAQLPWFTRWRTNSVVDASPSRVGKGLDAEKDDASRTHPPRSPFRFGSAGRTRRLEVLACRPVVTRHRGRSAQVLPIQLGGDGRCVASLHRLLL